VAIFLSQGTSTLNPSVIADIVAREDCFSRGDRSFAMTTLLMVWAITSCNISVIRFWLAQVTCTYFVRADLVNFRDAVLTTR
jgi:hypothetical protein